MNLNCTPKLELGKRKFDGIGQFYGLPKSSALIGKVFAHARKRHGKQFKLSAARFVLDGEIPVKETSGQLEAPNNTLRRWASEYGKDGEAAFPGKGKPVINKDHGILRPKEEDEKLRKEMGA